MTITRSLDQLRKLERPAQLFMGVAVLGGITSSMWILFFNFYILELGFNHRFIGLINSVTAVATLVFGIPLGLLSDKIGQKKAMLIGIGTFALASTIELLVADRILLLSMAFLSGVGGTLYYLNVAPFLMKVSKPENRTYLFSLNFGLVVLAGVLGNLCASHLSNLFVSILQVQSGSAMLYRAILVVAISLSYLELILLILIREPDLDEIFTNPIRPQGEWKPSTLFYAFKVLLFQPVVLKLALVQVVFGFGVAMISPYINLLFHEKFSVSDQTLGSVFALKALFAGLGSLMVPRFVRIIKDRVKVVSIAQLLGGIFALTLGIAPILPVAIFGFLLGGVFLNTPIPLLSAFSMEQVSENQRATLGSIREISWQIGWVAGPYLAGMLLDNYGFTPIFLTAFAVFSISALLIPRFFQRHEQTNLVHGQVSP